MSDTERPIKKRRIDENRLNRVSKLSTWLRQYTQFLTHYDAPFILSSYIKLALHSIGVLILLVVSYQMIQSCANEIQWRYQTEMKAFEDKTQACHYNYINNNCGPNLKGVYWQTFCEEWDKCRNLQPRYVGKTQIATQVLGEMMNGFVEPLTLKAMVIICLFVFGFFITSSFVVL